MDSIQAAPVNTSKNTLANEELFARMLFNRKLFTDDLTGPVQVNSFTLNLELEGKRYCRL